jgi:hypothetical protein
MSFRGGDADEPDVGRADLGYELEPSLREPLADAIEQMARDAESRHHRLLKKLKVEVREGGAYRLERSDRITLRDIAQRLVGEETVELRPAERVAIRDVASRATDVERGDSSHGPAG